MKINDKLAKYVLDSLVESEEYSKNTRLPSGKPSASGRSKPKSVTPVIKSSDEQEVDEEDLEEQQKMGKKARQEARRDYQTDREEMRKGIGWKERAENIKGHRKLSGALRGAMARMRKRKAAEREDSSTNWKDRIVDMLLEAFLGTSRDYVARAMSREDKGSSMKDRSKKGKALASVINKQPKVIKARAEKKAADDAQYAANRKKGGNSNLRSRDSATHPRNNWPSGSWGSA